MCVIYIAVHVYIRPSTLYMYMYLCSCGIESIPTITTTRGHLTGHIDSHQLELDSLPDFLSNHLSVDPTLLNQVNCLSTQQLRPLFVTLQFLVAIHEHIFWAALIWSLTNGFWDSLSVPSPLMMKTASCISLFAFFTVPYIYTCIDMHYELFRCCKNVTFDQIHERSRYRVWKK